MHPADSNMGSRAVEKSVRRDRNLHWPIGFEAEHPRRCDPQVNSVDQTEAPLRAEIALDCHDANKRRGSVLG